MTSAEYAEVLRRAKEEADEVVQHVKQCIKCYDDKQIEYGFLAGALSNYAHQLSDICTGVHEANLKLYITNREKETE